MINKNNPEFRESAEQQGTKTVTLEEFKKNLKMSKYASDADALRDYNQIPDADLPAANRELDAHLDSRYEIKPELEGGSISPERLEKVREAQISEKVENYGELYNMESQIQLAVNALRDEIDDAMEMIDNYKDEKDRTMWFPIPFYDAIKRIGKGKKFKRIIRNIQSNIKDLPPELQIQLQNNIHENDGLKGAGAKKLLVSDSLWLSGAGLTGAGIVTGGVGLVAGGLAASVAALGGYIHSEINLLSEMKDGNKMRRKLRNLRDRLNTAINPRFINPTYVQNAMGNAKQMAGIEEEQQLAA